MKKVEPRHGNDAGAHVTTKGERNFGGYRSGIFCVANVTMAGPGSSEAIKRLGAIYWRRIESAPPLSLLRWQKHTAASRGECRLSPRFSVSDPDIARGAPADHASRLGDILRERR